MKKYFTQLSALMCIAALFLVSIPATAKSKTPPLQPPVSPPDAGCTANAAQQLAERLPTLGRQSQSNPFLTIRKSVFKGAPVEFVSSSTGELGFAAADLSFAERSSVLFQRIYSSANREDVGLGRGWNFIFNDKIEADVFQAVLTTAAGEKYEFAGQGLRIGEKGNTQKFVLRRDEPALTQSFEVIDQKLIRETTAAAEKIYEKYGDAFYLTGIKMAGGEGIKLRRARDGKLLRISGDRGGEITLKWVENRLVSLSDNIGRKVFFAVADGFLKGVKTVTGGEWRFEYENERLSRAVDPAGGETLKARFDENGRILELGDETGTSRFSYEWENGVSRRTTVTNSENLVYFYEHTTSGIATRISDRSGEIARLEYDSANRLIRITDAANTVAAFEYDEKGNATGQQMPGEPGRNFEYDDQNRLLAVVSGSERTEFRYDADGGMSQTRFVNAENRFQAKFNRLGKPETIRSGETDVRFRYDAAGREIARIYSDGESFEKAYDAAGRLKTDKSPPGRVVNYSYNAENKIVRQTDNAGEDIRAEYDRNGLLSKMSDAKGWLRAARDRAGRITVLENSLGQKRRFRYNANGALTEFVNAKGETYKYFYTERGRLKGVANSKGTAVEYKFDAAGKPVAAKRTNYNGLPENAFAKINYEPPAAQSMDIYNCGELGFLDEFGRVQPVAIGIILSPELTPVCSDPFGDFSPNSPSSGFALGSINSSQVESCDKCTKRQKGICEDEYSSCNWQRTLGLGAGGLVVGGGVGAAVGTAVPVIGNIAGGVAGGLIGGIGGLTSGYMSCNYDRDACLKKVVDKCAGCK